MGRHSASYVSAQPALGCFSILPVDQVFDVILAGDLPGVSLGDSRNDTPHSAMLSIEQPVHLGHAKNDISSSKAGATTMMPPARLAA
jgi:hypothetical protein